MARKKKFAPNDNNLAIIRGTAARSSDETPVMGVERRGIVNADLYVNRKSRKP